MTLGFVATKRFKSILAVEWDKDAAETYRVNFSDQLRLDTDGRRSNNELFEGAIEKVPTFPKADVVVGGPPCQGFSSLNRDSVGLERRGLWREYLKALEQSKPLAFVMENVPELLNSQEYMDFKSAAESRALGFEVAGRILDAADYGVPQRRRRAIVIGIRSGTQIPWPAPTHIAPELAGTLLGLAPWVSFREAVDGLPQRPDGRHWHRGRNPTDISKRRYKSVPRNGGNRFQMQRNLDKAGLGDLVPPCWRNKPTGTTDVFGRLWFDRPSVTIRTEFFKPEKGRYLHPSAHRPITVREAARLMSFPDDFEFPEHQSMTSVARQIGNAVPPLLAQKIAESLARYLDSAREVSQSHFEDRTDPANRIAA
jgi:DNA (cytosine-5)-methyltransferase 1